VTPRSYEHINRYEQKEKRSKKEKGVIINPLNFEKGLSYDRGTL
jgi:hypothetical protein